MHRRIMVRLAAAAIALALSAATVPVYAATAPAIHTMPTVADQTQIGSVAITDKSFIEVKQVSILHEDEDHLVTFTLSIHNLNQYEIQFIDYWVRLMNNKGTSFSVNILPNDKDKNRIPAGSVMDIDMYAKVNKSTDLNQLVFKIIRWDFSAPNYERKLGDIKVPVQYSVVTPANKARILTINGTALKMAITRAAIGQNENVYLPKLTLSMENNGTKSVELPQVQYAIRTKEGLLYPLTASGTGDSNKTIYPRFTKEVQLTGTLPRSVSAEGWTLIITSETDTGSGKMTLPVAYFSVPKPMAAADDSITPVDEKKNVDVADQTLETAVKRVLKSKNEAFYSVAVSFTMKNIGIASVTLPNYRFAIQTADGLSYPAKADGLKDLAIAPLFTKEFSLSATIPSSINASGWKLLLLPPADADPDHTSDAAIAAYKLTDFSQEQGEVGRSYEFTNASGVYTAVMKGIVRLPWEDQDILSASLSISNKSVNPLPVPKLAGYFLLDDSVRVPATAVIKDNVISVTNSHPLQVQIYGMIPYTNQYSKLKLVLEEKTSDSETEDLLEFRTDSTTNALPVVDLSGSYRVEGAGRNASLSVRSVRSYSGIDADLFTVQLDEKNLEKRFTSAANLVAYFKTEDDTIYPAAISEMKDKIAPQGKATLYVSSNIPRSVNFDKLKLVVGFGVKDGQLAQGSAPDAYIDAVAFNLPKEDQNPKTDFKNLDYFPYTLTVRSFVLKPVSVAEWDGKVQLSFNYELSKNLLVQSNMEDHKLILEVQDSSGMTVTPFIYELDQPESEFALTLGYHTKTHLITDPALLYRVPYLNKYKVNIYDEFHGQKKLLASKELSWGVPSE